MNRAILACAALCCLGAAPPRPNVVLIVADDLGRGDLGCYGATKIATPNIDRLAREGVRFTDAHSTCAVCQPSRYAILSGTYFFRAQRKPDQLYFHDGQPTLPGVLRSAGYATAAFGKWHLGFGRADTLDYNGELKPGPLEVGFDHFFGTPRTHNEPPFVFVEDHRVVGLDPTDPIRIIAAKETTEGWGHGISTGAKKAHEARPVDTIDIVLAEKTTSWIAERTRSEPFFAYVAFLAPHVPIAPAKEFQGTSRAGTYGDYVQQLDACVGRVLDALDARGLAENTLVIFTSDNGGLYHREPLAAGHRTNGDLLGQKTDVWEGGHTVPLVARLPGRIPAGAACGRLVGLVDLMATIAGVCGIALPEAAAPDSIDQHGIFERPDAPALREELVLQGTGGFGLRQGSHVYLPRAGSMGLTVPHGPKPPSEKRFGQPWANLGFVADGVSADGAIEPDAPPDQLYDLGDDPRQRRNIVRDQPELAETLRARLEAIGPRQPGPPTAGVAAAPRAAVTAAPRHRAPTHADVAYGPHARQRLHFWKADATKPTPVVVFIHGGGWVGGDLSSGIGVVLEPLLEAGISVASVEYRLLGDAMREGVTPPVRAPMLDCARAVQFVRANAADWNVDPARLAVAGGSAGGCTSLWLAFHDDLADPQAVDPVARQSTRPACAAVINAQTSLDPVQMKQWMPNAHYGGHAFGILRKTTVDPPVAELGRFAMDFPGFLARRDELLPLIDEYSPYALVTPDDPPVYLFYRAAPALGQETKDPTHSANFGVKLEERCREAGVACELVHPESAAPVHADVTAFLIDFFRPRSVSARAARAGRIMPASFAKPAPGVGGAFFERHCVGCHDAASREGGLDLEALSRDLADPTTLNTWVTIHDRIAKGEMPPPDEERPPEADRRAVVAELDGWLTTADRAKRKRDGRAVYRRLTAAEYENALRDLLAIPHLDVRSLLPADGTRRGFDKAGDGLELSHVHIRQYLAAADRALDLAIATRPTPPPVLSQRFDVATMLKFRQNLNGGTAILLDGTTADSRWYGDGHRERNEHRIENETGLLTGKSIGFLGPNVAGAEKFVSFVPLFPGTYRMRMSLWSFRWHDGVVEPSPRTEVAMLQTRRRVFGYYDAPSLAPTVHEQTAWLADDEAPMFDVASIAWRPGESAATDLSSRGGRPGIAVDWFEVEGPINDIWPPRSHRVLFGDLPIVAFDDTTGVHPPARPPMRTAPWAWPARRDLPADEREQLLASVASTAPEADARRLLAAFLPAAFRRQASDEEVARYASIAVDRVAKGDCFEDAMREAYKAVLTSPHFLFRRESPGSLDDHAIASRLAFWLWNGPPDAALLDLARTGRLGEREVLRAQVERLLDDPRSDRFIADFLDQWLNLAKIDDTDPDRKLYPEFQFYYLKESMLAESRAFLRELVARNLPITSLVASDFAMLNERLAQHYRIPGLDPAAVAGSRIRRVTLPPGSHRGGFLTQGAVLKVTANGTVTSPVLRGVFVNERFLGESVPPPPPSVPAIEPDTRGAATMRELLARHRADASCAGCHRTIDPPGFALERFDPIGGWRDRYRSEGKGDPPAEPLFDGRRPAFRLGQPVDPSGEMPDGRAFADFEEFRRIVAGDPARLARAFVSQLVIYATGAEPSFADRREIDRIVQSTSTDGHGIRSLLHALAASPLFLEK